MRPSHAWPKYLRSFFVKFLSSNRRHRWLESFTNIMASSGDLKRSASPTDKEADDVPQKKVRLPKRKKMAILAVYSGKEYYGVQINPGFRTIESELIKALRLAGVIEQEHVDDMWKMWFQRASRTDKGVSAAGQVFSLLMRPHMDDPVSAINTHLPTDIRVVGIKKATKGFDSKNNCAYRTYEYLTPSFAFCSIEEKTEETFRISDQQMKVVNETLGLFKGTHNFFNFTSGRKFQDASVKRYIMRMEITKKFERDGYEFLVITIRGQSFMLHQIRKMIGLSMAITRGYAGLETLKLCWGANRIDIPKAPGLGLLLDKLHYDHYNKKFGRDGLHEQIDWTEYQETIEQFKMDHIYKDIITTEIEEKNMFNWLQSLSLHSYEVDERQDGVKSKSPSPQQKEDKITVDTTKQTDSQTLVEATKENRSETTVKTANENHSESEVEIANKSLAEATVEATNKAENDITVDVTNKAGCDSSGEIASETTGTSVLGVPDELHEKQPTNDSAETENEKKISVENSS